MAVTASLTFYILYHNPLRRSYFKCLVEYDAGIPRIIPKSAKNEP